MNITTQLAHLDGTAAICAVNLQDGETQIIIYASALASESALYADLAQKRAIKLALDIREKGWEVIREMVLPAQVMIATPVQSIAPTRFDNLSVASSSVATDDDNLNILNEPSQLSASLDDSGVPSDGDIAPW